MTSNSDPPETELGNHTTPVTEKPHMQVATRKETSSGFMLLSVKHFSKSKKNELFPTAVNDKRSQDNCFNGKGIANTSLDTDYNNPHPNTLANDLHFSSTASLDAEEYEDDEEELVGLNNYQNVLNTTPMVNPQCQANHCTGPNTTQISHMEQYTHRQGHPVENIPPALQTQQHMSTGNGWTFPNNAQMSNSIAQSVFDAQVPCEPSTPRQPPLFYRLHSTAGIEPPRGIHPSHPVPQHAMPLQISENYHVPVSKQSDPSFDIHLSPAIPLLVSNSLQNFAQPPSQPVELQQVRQINGEEIGSDPVLSTLKPPVQPASRFRKSRIRETVEHWGSNRISFHDCHLKKVPDWVSYLQTKPANTLNNPIIQRGRCLYCFVSGYIGPHCTEHQRKQSKLPKNLSFPSNSVPVSSQVAGLLQATFIAYHSANVQGFNLDSLLSVWDNGQRLANQNPLVSAELFSSQLVTATIAAFAAGGGLKTNASAPDFLNEQGRLIAHTAAHNSADFYESFTAANGKGYSGDEGLTLIARASEHIPLAVTEHSATTLVAPLQINPATEVGEIAAPRTVTDPSAAYLRRYQSLSTDEPESPRTAISSEYGSNLANTVTAPPCTDQQATPPKTPGLTYTGSEGWNPLVINESRIPEIPLQAGAVFAIHQDPRLLTPHERLISNSIVPSASAPPSPDIAPKTITAGMFGNPGVVELPNGPLNSRTLSQCESEVSQAAHFVVTRGIMDYLSQEHRASCPPPQATDSQPHIQMALDTMTPTVTPATEELTRQHETFVGGVAFQQQVGKRELRFEQGRVVMPGHLEAQMPKCLDVIRGAIMTTIQDQFTHLSSENDALRQTVSSLQQENQELQSYRRAFFNFRSYFDQEQWDRIATQMDHVFPGRDPQKQQQQEPPAPPQQSAAPPSSSTAFPPQSSTHEVHNPSDTQILQQQQQHSSSVTKNTPI